MDGVWNADVGEVKFNLACRLLGRPGCLGVKSNTVVGNVREDIKMEKIYRRWTNLIWSMDHEWPWMIECIIWYEQKNINDKKWHIVLTLSLPAGLVLIKPLRNMANLTSRCGVGCSIGFEWERCYQWATRQWQAGSLERERSKLLVRKNERKNDTPIFHFDYFRQMLIRTWCSSVFLHVLIVSWAFERHRISDTLYH